MKGSLKAQYRKFGLVQNQGIYELICASQTKERGGKRGGDSSGMSKESGEPEKGWEPKVG